MKKELTKVLGREIGEFRTALIYNAKVCDWQSFERKAGMLFDYLESRELSFIRAVFLRIIRATLAVLIAAGAALWIASRGLSRAALPYENYLIVLILALFCFLVFFFLDFQIITKVKASRHGNKRQTFISSIEKDFKSRLGEVCPYAAGGTQDVFLNA